MSGQADPILTVTGLTKRFGDFLAVDDIGFTVDREGITALIGPNGAGKTTTYNLVTGSVPPTSGRIVFDGTDIADRSVTERAAMGLGRSFQITNIYEGLTVRQNLRVPVTARSAARFDPFHDIDAHEGINEEVDDLLGLLGITDQAEAVCETLPYGAKRRVELGIALASDPKLVLLDEPTAGMTPTETVELVDLIRRLASETETAFFLTEHNMNVVFAVAAEIIVLHRGSILTTGTPAEIREHEAVREAYLGGGEDDLSRGDVSDSTGPPTAETPLLSVEDIHTYYDQSHILDGVSLEVYEGEIVGLLGRNGAGKTTTLRSIAGLTPPRRGTVRYRDAVIDGRAPHRISGLGIGYVPEEREVFAELTVAENLDIARRPGSDWTIEETFELFPALRENASSMGDELSGGEQQMLAIARALVADPDLLLLDEPSEGLAPIIVEDLEEILTEISDAGMTILLAEQNTQFALALNDRNYILDTGQIQWEGPTAELIDTPELIDEYLALSGVEEAL